MFPAGPGLREAPGSDWKEPAGLFSLFKQMSDVKGGERAEDLVGNQFLFQTHFVCLPALREVFFFLRPFILDVNPFVRAEKCVLCSLCLV